MPVSGNSAPVSDNSIPKLDRKYTHIVNNDASVGLNGVPGQHEVSDTTRGNAFLEGMSNVFNTVGNAVGQGVNKLKQALVSSGNASWFGGEEQKAAAEQALREEEAANREAINEYRDYRNTLKEEHPIAYGAGDFLTKSQLYRGAGGLGAATGAEAALSGKIGETGANLALGQAADVLLDTIPTEIENYQNGMSGKDIAIDTAKNLGTNALFNLGAEGLQTLPGLLKNAANNWTADQLARQEVENAIKAESAPIAETAENTLKQLEPPVAPVREELNPLGMATKDAELEELAAQRQSAMDAIDGLRQEIPETPSQPLTDLANGQTVETLTDTVKPEITANKSELQTITDSIINARNGESLVGNGYSDAGQAYMKNVDSLMKQETNLLQQAGKSKDPAVKQLLDEVRSTGDDYWDNVLKVNTPVNPDLINTHRQALENLENYMKNTPANNSNKNIIDNFDYYLDGMKGANSAGSKYSASKSFGKNRDGILREGSMILSDAKNVVKYKNHLGEEIDPAVTAALKEAEAAREELAFTTVNTLNPEEYAIKYSDAINKLYDSIANDRKRMFESQNRIMSARKPLSLAAQNIRELEIPSDTKQKVLWQMRDLGNYVDDIEYAKTADEVNSLLGKLENAANDVENALKQNGVIREIKKGDFDEPTQAFVNALNGKKIYLSPEVRANFTDMKNINDFGNALYFNGNSGRFKPAFRATNKNATAIDAIFPEIDRETGYAISNYMKANGLNPDNAADQVRGLLDYGNYLKSNKDSLKVRPYEGGILDDFMGNIRKTADDKIKSFGNATEEPISFEDQMRLLERRKIEGELDINKMTQDAIRTGRSANGEMVTGVGDAEKEAKRLIGERAQLEKKLNDLKSYDERADEDLDALTGFVDSLRQKAANQNNNGIKQLNNVVTPNNSKLALDLQFFADKANDIQKQIDNMADGPEKDELRKALDEFWGKMYGAGTKDEAEEAWNALSKTRTNTMFKSGDFSDYELENVIPESIAKYVTEEETKPYNAAIDRMKSDYNGQLERFTKNYADDKEVRANLGNAEDINGMYLMAQDLAKRARATDDFGERVQLYAQARQVSRNLIKAERESGRSIQALAKFSRTPERMIQRAEGLAEDFVDKSLSKEPNLKKGIEEVSDQINNFLKEVDADALKREEVEEMVNRAISMNKRVRSRLNKGDVQKITNAIMEERQYADIQKQLEFLSTGYRDIDGDTMEKVQDMFNEAQDLPFNSKKRVDLENDAFKLLASRIAPEGGTFRDKIDAWRYLSMLANPTTHLKNMLGNFSFGKGMVSTKNNLAALIEGAADNVSKLAGKGGIDRTKAILNPAKDSALIKAAGEDGLENAFRELSGSHYFDAGKSIDNAIPAFNTKTKLGRFLNRTAEINEGLLSKEDEMAMMSKYKTSLAGYLKANGADASIFKATDDQSKQLLENGRQYAINQAKEAAFHQDAPFMQKFSNFTNDLKNGTKGEQAAGLILDTIVPFKKTPANILKSAFAYSPLEWGKVLTDIDLLKKGADATGKAFKAADFIDDISKAATGTAAFTIGAILAHEGILKVGSDLSDEESSFDKQTGRQNVSIKVGDVYVPIQELMPSAAPLIFGGTVYETLKNKKDGDTAINTLAAGTGAIANGLIDMSMLSGIADTLKSVRGAETNTDVITNLAVNAGGNFASQMLPTVGRKANVTIDDTKRATYSDKKGIAKTIDQEAKYLQTKIPGLQQAGEKLKESDIPALQKAGNRLALEPNIDVKGQVQESPGVAGNNGLAARAANNFLSPVGNITKDTSTKYDEERRRLAKETGETKVLPYIGSKEAEIDGVRMSPKDWTEYRKTRGQLREKLAEGIIDDSSYKTMSDEDKAAVLKDVDDFTKNYSQSKFGKKMDSTTKNRAEIYEKEGVKGLMDTFRVSAMMEGKEHDNQETRLAELKKLSKEDQKRLMPKALSTDTERQRWDDCKHDLEKYWASYDKDMKQKKLKQLEKDTNYKQADISDPKQAQKELAALGVKNDAESVDKYARAKKAIPSMTMQNYANYVKKMARGDGDINQKDLIKYANQNHFTQKEMETYWKAFTDSDKFPKYSKKKTWYF